MSDSATLLFLLGTAGFALGVLFLYIAIFRSGWLWGLVCLLLPPLLLLFIPLRWRQTQYGLYTLLAGLLVGGAALYAGADAPVQTWLERPQVETYLAKLGWHGEIRLPFKSYQPAPLPNAAQAAAIRTQEADAQKVPETAATPKPPSKEPPHVRPSVFQPASLDALGKFVGSTVRVTGTDGGQVSGELKRVDSMGVTVAVAQGAGGVAYHLAWTRVSRVEVYAPEGSVPPPIKISSGNAVAASGTLAAPTSSAPASSVTLTPAPKVTPLPPTATHTPTMPIAPPAAAAQAPSSAVDGTTGNTQ